ncbi:MAG: T9SS type A sorting domain-containing protein [bacterium]
MKYSLYFLVAIVLVHFIGATSFAQIKKTTTPYPDDPQARIEYDFTRLRDPQTDEIPSLIGQKEFEFASKLPKKNPFANNSNVSPLPNWVAMGPWNQSGRVQALGIDIQNEGNMLAGTASGGVWRTIDTGNSWVKVTLPNDEQTISAIVQDTRPNNEHLWYYSTGELLSTTGRRETSNIRTHSWGNGIYRSYDNGATWNPILSTITDSKHTAPENFTGIWNLALDSKNQDADIIYAACYGGIMRSSDGGASWTDVLGGKDSIKCFNSEIVIGRKGTLYAAIGSSPEGKVGESQGIWRSTDGISWIRISNSTLPRQIRRIRLALSESDESIVYCITETPDDWKVADTLFITNHSFSRYHYLSGDGTGSGGTWQKLQIPFDKNQQPYNNTLGGYCLTLGVDPRNSDVVFVGGNNLYYSDNGFTLADYEQIGGYPYDMLEGSLHPDMHCIAFSLTSNHTLFVGNDGGVASTDDYSLGKNTSWKSYNNGLASTQVYHSSLDHGTPGDNFVLSGLQDNSTYATFDSTIETPWFVVAGGDGMTTSILDGLSQFFTSWQGDNIDCFYNDGVDITYKGSLLWPAVNAVSAFFTNFIIDPVGQNQLYLAATDQLFRFNDLSQIPFNSHNIPADWTEIGAVYSLLHPAKAFITTFGFAHDSSAQLFFGASNGHVYQIEHASQSNPPLTDISSPMFPQNGFVASIEVDPLNANEIIIVFSNYHVESVFRTTNGGTSWDAISGNLEELRGGGGSGPSVRCAKILHTPSGTIYYVGTSVGLFSTTIIDGSKTSWVQEGPTTIGNLIVEALDARQSDGRVIVSTQGGGVFRNSTGPSSVSNHHNLQEKIAVEQNYPNPFDNVSTICFSISDPCTVRIDLHDVLGTKLSTLANSFFGAGNHCIELSSERLSNGKYFLRFTNGNEAITKVITVVK